MMKRLLPRFVLVAMILSATSGLAADRVGHHMDRGIPRPGPAGMPFDPTLEAIQANVFTPSCSQSYCHGSSQAADLHLEDGYSLASLVNVESVEVAGVLRVAPYSADNSYLICKLEACSSMVGVPMPVIGYPLDPAVISVIRTWIDNGAEGPVAVENSSWGEIKSTYR